MVKKVFPRIMSEVLPHHYDKPVELAIIGGTGLYDLPNLKPVAKLTVNTPWGHPSSPITISEMSSGFPVAFLARHGTNHDLLPTDVPSRANMAALKKIGVKAIVAFSAVGSLREEIKPRDFVLPTQVIDRTKGNRPHTFFEKGFVGHAMFGEPFDLNLNKLIKEAIPETGFLEGYDKGDLAPTFHTKKEGKTADDLTLICMEGPQFSTRAESQMYRSFGGAVINMSCLPESKLAREAEISYQMICMSTDYDSWNVDEEPVTVETVVGNLKANSANACKVAETLINKISKEFTENKLGINKDLQGSMKFAVSTKPEALDKEMLQKMHYLFPGYWPVK